MLKIKQLTGYTGILCHNYIGGPQVEGPYIQVYSVGHSSSLQTILFRSFAEAKKLKQTPDKNIYLHKIWYLKGIVKSFIVDEKPYALHPVDSPPQNNPQTYIQKPYWAPPPKLGDL